jgi:chromate transporter
MKPRRRDLARTFFTVGATAYGGPAIVAQIRKAIVLDKRWVSEADFQDTLAFCQTLPGPVAVQTAAHLGWRLYGGLGVFIALVSYVSPAFLLMLGLSAAYFRYGQMAVVATAFAGLGAVIVAIVAQSILSLAQPTVRDVRGLFITAFAAWGFFTSRDTLLVLALAAVAGLVLFSRGRDADRETEAPGAARTVLPPYRRTVLTVAVVAASGLAFVPLSGLLSRELPSLAATMTKINLLAFGGGYTAIALMFREVVASTGHAWLTSKQFIDGLALGQITPGPVIITGTFIGYRVGGVAGAVVASLFVFLPSSLLLVLLAPHFARFREATLVKSAVRGLLAAFVAMLLYVLARVAESAFADLRTVPIALAAFIALERRAPMVVVIVAAIVVALVAL